MSANRASGCLWRDVLSIRLQTSQDVEPFNFLWGVEPCKQWNDFVHDQESYPAADFQ